MKVTPVSPVYALNSKLPKKELTVLGCCDNIDITVGNTTVMFGAHQFEITIVYCNGCGETKATSNIKRKGARNG